MNTRFRLISKTTVKETCISPEVGQLLSDYFVELLEDSAAEEVEDHLLDCVYCRNRYLQMLTIMSTNQKQSDPGQEKTLLISMGASPAGGDIETERPELTFVAVSHWRFTADDDPQIQTDSERARSK